MQLFRLIHVFVYIFDNISILEFDEMSSTLIYKPCSHTLQLFALVHDLNKDLNKNIFSFKICHQLVSLVKVWILKFNLTKIHLTWCYF